MYLFVKEQYESGGGTGKRVKTTLKILIFFLQRDVCGEAIKNSDYDRL